MLRVKIKYFREGLTPIQKIVKGDWVDLRAGEDIYLKAGEFTKIPLGVGMALPKGYEALVVPRSSTFEKWGIIQTNSIGVIDNSYCGNNDEWALPVLAIRDTMIPKNVRIAQFRITKSQPRLCYENVIFLNSVNRGGFGSTGEN